MTTRDALARFLAPLHDGGELEDWLADDWFRLRIAGRLRPVLPLYPLKRAQALHDVHHVLTGYGPGLLDELRLAGWELGSGGCRWNVFFWVDRLLAFLLGLVCTPRGTLAAFRRGLRGHNLYGRELAGVLAADVDELRAEALGQSDASQASRRS